MDYRTMFDDKWVKAWDLQGKDITVTIEKVEAGTLEGKDGRKAKKPIVTFVGSKKPLALNKTNSKIIAAIYGNDTRKWIGKAITLYPTQTSFGGETIDCIRVRPGAPSGKGAPMPEAPPHPAESEAA